MVVTLNFITGIFLKYDQDLDASEQAPQHINTNDKQNLQVCIVSVCFTLFSPNLWPLIQEAALQSLELRLQWNNNGLKHGVLTTKFPNQQLQPAQL